MINNHDILSRLNKFVVICFSNSWNVNSQEKGGPLLIDASIENKKI